MLHAPKTIRLLSALLTIPVLLCGGFLVPAAPASAETPVPVSTPQMLDADLAAGKSRVLDIPADYTDLMIADPKIADVLPLSKHSVYLVGKTMGATTLTVYGPNKRLVAVANVVVSADIETLKTRLHEILPNEDQITVRGANQSVVLSGTVSSPASLQQALTLAESFAPTKVVNMLGVQGTQQVMLSVRFVEMDRTTAKDLKLNLQSIASGSGDSVFKVGTNSRGLSLSTGDTIGNNLNVLPNLFGGGALRLSGGADAMELLFEALEQKGLIKTLAEPNLVAMSGDTASFLAGGEFPIPVAQSNTGTNTPTITIEYKQFGVALGFTPTILKDGMINMIVNPEVSSIDPTVSINLGNIKVPGIKVRRARTTVELRDGESFIVAGLLKDDYQSQIRQFPGLGDMPVLGALFRSNGYQHDQTELVIVVTPHLVSARQGQVATPDEKFVPPSDVERFLMGNQGTVTTQSAQAGGHVLY